MSAEKYHLGPDRIGYLSEKSYNRAKWAYDYQVQFCPWLRVAGYINFEHENDRVHRSSNQSLGMPLTLQTYLEIQRLVQLLNRFPSLEEAAADSPETAWVVDMLGREVQTAVYRWPIEEKPHHIEMLRCGDCDQLTLWYKPPRHPGDQIIVACRAQNCTYVLDENLYGWAVRLIEEEENERKAMADNKRSAKKGA